MSNDNYWDDDDDLDTNDNTNDGGDLVKKLRKKSRVDEKRIKELEEQLGTYTKVERERTVKEVLEKQGVNPKAARLALKDLDGDITPDAVLNWLDDNGELFGYNPAQDAPVSNENREALRRQDSVTQGASTPNREEDLAMRIENASSQEELNAILYSQQS